MDLYYWYESRKYIDCQDWEIFCLYIELYTSVGLICFHVSYEILSAVGSNHIEGWDKMAAILRTTFSSAFS